MNNINNKYKKESGAEEVIQQLGTLAALAEFPGLIPRTYRVAHNLL